MAYYRCAPNCSPFVGLVALRLGDCLMVASASRHADATDRNRCKVDGRQAKTATGCVRSFRFDDLVTAAGHVRPLSQRT